MPIKKKTKSSKLKRFFSNPRNVILFVFILGFAGIGSYKIYQSSAKSYKSPTTVPNCYVAAVQGGSSAWLRYYSSGKCVLTYTKALAAIDDASGNKLGYVPVSDFFSSVVKEKTIAYQKSKNIEASGTVGPQTWAAINTDCYGTEPFSATELSVRAACGY